MRYVVKNDDKEFRINLEEHGENIVASLNGKTVPVQLKQIAGSHTVSALIGNRSIEVEITKNETAYILHYQGQTLKYAVADERTSRLKNSMAGSAKQKVEKELKAPMPGLVVSINAEPGQKISRGEGLLIIEAMKMENEIKAPFDATVKEIKVESGQAVEMNQVLILFD